MEDIEQLGGGGMNKAGLCRCGPVGCGELEGGEYGELNKVSQEWAVSR